MCEEASCPNLAECFNHGTATFMIMGAICTRRCPFCDVAHYRPLALDPDEPKKLALTIKEMGLKYVVITSVDRDDLRDGGAQHFADCIKQIREHSPQTRIEILTPDFRTGWSRHWKCSARPRLTCSTTTWKPPRACTGSPVRVPTTSGR